MLLRNLSQSDGLCNGTRLIITNLGHSVIEAKIITGSNVGDIVYIPRISLIAKKKKAYPLLYNDVSFLLEYAML